MKRGKRVWVEMKPRSTSTMSCRSRGASQEMDVDVMVLLVATGGFSMMGLISGSVEDESIRLPIYIATYGVPAAGVCVEGRKGGCYARARRAWRTKLLYHLSSLCLIPRRR